MDFEARKKEFLEAYGKLREEFRCDFMATPQFTPNPQGTWAIVVQPEIVDLEKVVTPSPFTVD